MSAIPAIQVQAPDLRALLNAHKQEILANFNCHQIGTIESFDATKQTAEVSLSVLRVVYNRPQTDNEGLQLQPVVIAYPLLVDVPVFVLSGGNARVTLPIAKGDTCLVLFNDRDMDAWFTTGTTLIPNSPRLHSLSDGLALVGFRSAANRIANYNATDAEFRLGNAVVRIKPNGTIEAVGGGGGTVTIDQAGNVSAVAAAGARFTLAEKAGIASSSRSLLSAMNAVVTALTALNLKTGPSASGQIAAASAAINEVLE